ncbi:choline ABC transporter substrate-binding protein [Hansschlegelia plantiphila]|uniref:Glycine/betaine ABC transporter substrate-binding protein n=1 Tax=Hansschlegelia plantiphila TaxID=374655 RepID=A0A9W6J2V7_9HYPH|nr:choline ABC transporter substrate-binding protein [Hansschlegelia plantiphila]GLK69855.1 glycine/betaine ABC transporter substrate-binding protein [Hansschlegelia plantiphila]
MRRLILAALCVAFSTASAFAAEPASCRKVRFSDVGWTDISATTATASLILEALGYQPATQIYSIPVTYAGLKNKQIDAYLGDWQPSMVEDRRPYLADKSIEVLGSNLTGAKYTLAVPKYTAEAGVKDFSDLQKHASLFNRTIYGIEPGNSANRMILDMIEKGEFGLAGWKLVESSEQGMLTQVDRAIRDKKWVVFLGWAPHPMNTRYAIDYLAGGDAFFGPNYGGAEVFTNIRAGYGEECPNVVRFLSKLRFTLDMENEMMAGILDEGKEPKVAAADWLKAHPEVVGAWLDGVQTYAGGDAQAAVKGRLGS